jgi:hypothetical protein
MTIQLEKIGIRDQSKPVMANKIIASHSEDDTHEGIESEMSCNSAREVAGGNSHSKDEYGLDLVAIDEASETSLVLSPRDHGGGLALTSAMNSPLIPTQESLKMTAQLPSLIPPHSTSSAQSTSTKSNTTTSLLSARVSTTSESLSPVEAGGGGGGGGSVKSKSSPERVVVPMPDDEINKHGIGPIGHASNYLRKHQQQQQQYTTVSESGGEGDRVPEKELIRLSPRASVVSPLTINRVQIALPSRTPSQHTNNSSPNETSLSMSPVMPSHDKLALPPLPSRHESSDQQQQRPPSSDSSKSGRRDKHQQQQRLIAVQPSTSNDGRYSAKGRSRRSGNEDSTFDSSVVVDRIAIEPAPNDLMLLSTVQSTDEDNDGEVAGVIAPNA